jgi:hydroxyacylglutathione hydrolase
VSAWELGPFAARAVVVESDSGPAAVIVDPGLDVDTLLDAVRQRRLQPVAIVLTHAHIDHAFGSARAKAAFPDAPLLLHRDDLPLFSNLAMQAEMFGLDVPEPAAPDGFLADGDLLPCGAEHLLVRHCPGHSPGHIVLIHESPATPFAVVGDVLFQGSIGRTDLWGGSFEQLEHSIREVLYRLPDATRVIPGHGADTTIGIEKRTNPFVAERPDSRT